MNIMRRVIALVATGLFLCANNTFAGGGSPPPPPPSADFPNPGPGLGNLSYSNSELFKPTYIIDQGTGLPNDYPFRKAFGLNTAAMINGYMVVPFAPDSGWGPGGFLVYDVSNPRDLKLVKEIYDPEGRTEEFRESHAIGSAIINGKTYLAVQTIKGIEIWDFSDVNDIKQASKVVLPGVDAGDYTDVAWQLWWQAPYMYVAVSNQGIYIVDTSNPANPVIANRGSGRPNPVPINEIGGTRVGPIFTMGNHLVISGMDQVGGITSADISDPLNPVFLDKTGNLPADYYAICFTGDKIVASVRGSGAKMRVYDVSDPANLVLENSDLVVNEQLYCGTQDQYVFQGAQDYVHKIDISNPNNYVELGSGNLNVGQFPDHGQVAPFGNLVFVGNDHGNGSGFIVHDTNPDLIAPSVVQVSPRNGTQRQALTSRIGVAMTDSILLESANSSTFIVRPQGGTAISGQYSVQLGIVNFVPDQPLIPNTTYEVVVTANGMQDYAGNTTAQSFSSNFTTGNALDQSLINHWKLDDNGTDAKGSNNAMVNGLGYTEGGHQFSSQQNQYIQLDTDISGIIGGSATMSYYFKTTQSGAVDPWDAPGFAGRDDKGLGNQDVFWGWIDQSGRLALSAGNDNGIRSPSVINDNQWRHITMSRNAQSGVLKMYLDGQLVATGTNNSGNYGGNDWNKVSSLMRIEDSDNKNQTLEGYVDDIKIFNRPLNDTEVADLYSRGAITVPETLTTNGQEVGQSKIFSPEGRLPSGAQYQWNFGDGNISSFNSNPQASHTYTAPGHYQVTLTVDTAGASQTFTFTHTVYNPLTADSATFSNTIAGDAAADRIYNVNPDNNTVTAMTASSLQKLWETNVGQNPRALAIAPNGKVFVTVKDIGKLIVLNSNGTINGNGVDFGYGSAPEGIAISPDGSSAVIALAGKSEVAVIDINTLAIQALIPVTADPRGVAITGDSSTAYVTRFRSTDMGAEVYKIDLRNNTVAQTLILAVDTTTVDGEDRSRGVPNYLHQLAISPDGLHAWLPSKKDNIVRGQFRDGQALEHDVTVRSILSQLDLNTGTELFAKQIDFNDRAPARAVTFSPRGDYVFVLHMESNMLEIIDAYTGEVRGGINDVGSAPRGVYLDTQRQRLYVHNFLSRDVASYDVANVINSVSFSPNQIARTNAVQTEKLSATVKHGKQLFYKANDIRMSEDGYMSCASCHNDGGDDGMVWDFTDRGEGLRNTITLRGRSGVDHGNVHWTANFDEIQDFENDIRNAFGGTGFMSDSDFNATSNPLGAPKAGLSADLDALTAYVDSLSDVPESPAKTSTGQLSAQALMGQAVFNNLNCASCHSGTTFQDNLRHDVGSLQLGSGSGLNGIGFDTPTLKGVWNTPPYMHNGQSKTLLEVLSGHGNTDSINTADREALIEYVKSLD